MIEGVFCSIIETTAPVKEATIAVSRVILETSRINSSITKRTPAMGVVKPAANPAAAPAAII